MVGISSREIEEGITSLTDSGKEKSILDMDQNAPSTSKPWSGKQYLKKYDKAVASLPKPTKETAEQSTKQPVEKQKELRYVKALPKDKA